MSWNKLPPIEPKSLNIGCLNCSTAAYIAPLDMCIAVGFGAAFVTEDGSRVYDGEADFDNGKESMTVADIEEIAAADPDHDWRIIKDGPLHGETFQRHGKNLWVCVETTLGFA